MSMPETDGHMLQVSGAPTYDSEDVDLESLLASVVQELWSVPNRVQTGLKNSPAIHRVGS